MSTSGTSKKYSASGVGRKPTATGSREAYGIERGNTSDIGTPYPFTEGGPGYFLLETGGYLLLETGYKIQLEG